jgi:hypothetical protein
MYLRSNPQYGWGFIELNQAASAVHDHIRFVAYRTYRYATLTGMRRSPSSLPKDLGTSCSRRE